VFREIKKYIRKYKKTKEFLNSKKTIGVKGHMQILDFFHSERTPKTYLEIGVNEGHSIILANKKTKTIGIDPMNFIVYLLNKNTKMYFMASDDFFEKYDVVKLFKGQKIDLAFIDGMHLFDYALRDFISVEKNCHNDSTIIIHDTIPKDKETSGREMPIGFWTGDVYKIILILKKYRPDLKLYNFGETPGICIVKNLDPASSVLKDNYDKIIQEYMNLTFDDIQSDLNEQLSVLDMDKFENIENRL